MKGTITDIMMKTFISIICLTRVAVQATYYEGRRDIDTTYAAGTKKL